MNITLNDFNCGLPIKLTLDKQKWRISYIFNKK